MKTILSALIALSVLAGIADLCQCSRYQDLLGPAGAPVPLTQLDRAAAALAAAAHFDCAARQEGGQQ